MDVFSARRVIKEALLQVYGTSYEHDVCFVLKYCFGLSSCWDTTANVDDLWLYRVADDIKKSIPIQYICGVEEFRGKPFFVFPDVFIPREETEDLVDIALEAIPEDAHVLEVGVGTGVIGVSILMGRQDINVIGIDINPLAVVNTFVNARKFDVVSRLQLYHADVFSFLENYLPVNFIVSNPPYLPDGDRFTVDNLVNKEPEAALYGGNNGVDFIHCLLNKLVDMHFHGGFLFEFDDTTRDSLEKHEIFTISRVKYYRDRFGKERFALVWL
ncbi:MAG: HemK family protein methyltransferase [Dictyoglomi bacterium]|nr:HemK family protein methyltransferase [Dictyoglomota bacterium]